ncbi:MAG: hypothetical protein KF764_30605 [Labilithrix sp.]|nr:hypothetical protein [Labilithrix sp.]MBX3220132.1 hypothetical protein [Labilithrix sp.]
MISSRVAGAFALALLLVTACGDAARDEAALGALQDDGPVRVSSRQRVDVDVRSTAPIKLGKNTVLVTFPADPRAELTSASALMPAHGHGSPEPKIARGDDGGFVVRDLVLYMSGRWELRLTLRVDEHEDEAIVAVDVP